MWAGAPKLDKSREKEVMWANGCEETNDGCIKACSTKRAASTPSCSTSPLFRAS